MLGLNTKLKQRQEAGKPINTGLVGAGQMGKGMVSQMMLMKGMTPGLVIDINVDNAVEAYTLAGISREDIVVAKNLSQLNEALEKGKFVASDNAELAAKANLIDVVVDATGVPDVGAKIAMDSIFNKKHIVMLNVETDVVIGPLLKQMADSAGVIYTGSAGDEPGSVKELYDFADGMGFDIVAIGKGKNNPVNLRANPENVYEQATKSGVSPKMLTSFKDGTKTMVEMTAMANATGYIPDIRGGHAPSASVNELPGIFQLKEQGGILNKYKIVDYVNGVAPGVFIIVTTELPQIHHEMQYLSMGAGPNYVLYRPYHLTSLETPLSAARAVLYHEPTIVPMGGKPIAETITVAKKDLKAGEMLDGIGGFTVYGTIDTYEKAKGENAVPLGLITKNTKLIKDVKEGQLITYDMIELDTSTLIYKLRNLQETLIG
ncbi:NAD(P)-dependent oxidoreductase [Irregularibacter muris]|jgi:predicted homoserine dehydrogenase-like protein|uniref:NAD(P)-dependent oxidoreductase n=1 Tax=Irregularibacter muris TaxID=1796619 RepID=A0AAE3HDY8_9FIRM|nr:NAD(P)-dependent oxidoreductase [Irregularibacter muris]MCR1898707.1 NAD(P)-dependent oxidoreductase [Irregularibacter muris]